MINCESKVFDNVASALRSKFDDIYIIGVEISDVPPRFPAVSIVQTQNEVNTSGSTFEHVENVASEEYKIEVCSNLESPKEAKEQIIEIISIIDGVMGGLYYVRSFCQPIPNADTKYTRRIARYKNTTVTEEDM